MNCILAINNEIQEVSAKVEDAKAKVENAKLKVEAVKAEVEKAKGQLSMAEKQAIQIEKIKLIANCMTELDLTTIFESFDVNWEQFTICNNFIAGLNNATDNFPGAHVDKYQQALEKCESELKESESELEKCDKEAKALTSQLNGLFVQFKCKIDVEKRLLDAMLQASRQQVLAHQYADADPEKNQQLTEALAKEFAQLPVGGNDN